MKNEVAVVDLGGTHLRTALVKNKKISDFTRKNTSKNKEELLKDIVEGIGKCINKNTKRIGISCAGVIENGVVKVSPNLPFKNFNLKKFLEKKFNKKIVVENDANCFALAESKYGVKKKNFFILTLGTGIGGGVIIDGKLYKGMGSGGELGHIILNNKKDFEYLASSQALKRVLKTNSVKKFILDKSSKTSKIKKELADYVGQGVASLISVFDPEIVVLGGGMRRLGSGFMKDIKIQTKKYNFLPKTPEIKWSTLENPGLLGASLLFD